MRIGSQRVTFVVIQTIAIRRDTGHQHVSHQPVTGGFDGSFDLGGSGPALPVIDVVEDYFEARAGERGLD